MGKKKKSRLAGILAAVLGLMCALVLGVVFYGTMVYQLVGEDGTSARQASRMDAQAMDAEGFPGAVLTLGAGTLRGEQPQDIRMGGENCRVMMRVYELDYGEQATAISACPAAFMEYIAQDGWKPQLITGFVLAGLDAVYLLKGDRAMLAARDGDFVYMLEAPAGEQTVYSLGAAAWLEGTQGV